MHHNLVFHKDKDKENYTMNRYITTNVNHVGFKNISVARFTRIFSPMLKSYLITYVSKKGAVNRRSLLLSLFLLFISVSIVSCGTSSSPSPADNEGDLVANKQQCSSSNSISISIPYTSSDLQLTNSDDRDCFRFTLSAGRTVNMSTDGSTDTLGRLYNSTGTLLETDFNNGSGSNFEIIRDLSAGTYYVEVASENSSTGSYTLRVTQPFPDPACSLTSISSIPYSSSGSGLSSSQDRDCFRFTLSAGRTVNMSTAGSTDTVGRLYNSTGTLLETDFNNGSGSNFEIIRDLSAGTYYVEVASENSSTGSYTLRVTQPFPDPACSLTSISSIPYGSSGSGLSSSQDRDCFRFTLSAGRTVTMSTTGSTDTLGRLYTSTGTLLETDFSDGSGSNFEISRSLSAGTYYVEVASENSGSGSYTLRVTQPFPDPACSLTSISSIPYSSSGSGLSSSQDRDCFRFTLSAGRTVTMSTTGSTDTLGRLYTSTGTLLETDFSDGSGSNFEISRSLSAGTYYVEVASENSRSGSYTLRVTQPFPDPACSLASISSIPYGSSGLGLSSSQDRDCFSFTLSAGRTVNMSTAGSTDTVGRLYTSTGTLLETNSNDGSGSNFEISRDLSAGTYYVEVASENSGSGSYTLRVTQPFPDPACSLTSISIPYAITSHNLSHAGDRDCFSFTLSTSRNITMSTASSIDTVGRLYNSTGTLLETDFNNGSGYNFEISRDLSAGTYYVEVASQNSSSGSYTLRVAQTFPGPACSLTSISSIPYTSSSSSLSPAGDRDCFRFTLSTSRNITMSTASLIDTLGRLYTYNGSLIEENDDISSSNRNFLIRRTLSAGIYYLEVFGYQDSVTGPYTLNVTYGFPPPPSPLPSSCQSGNFTPISSIPYRSIVLQLSPAEDRDCFRFILSRSRNITMSTASSIDTFGRLYDSSGNWIEENDDGGSNLNFLIKRTLSAGTYYIEVAPHISSSGGPYTLDVADPNSLPFSCQYSNFAFISSIPYTSSSSSLSPAGDRDCFRFTLNTSRNITISTTSSINTFGELYTSSESLIASNDNDGGNGDFLIERTLSAGTYYVEVSGFAGNTTGPYTLNVAPSSLGSLSHVTSVPDTTSLNLNGTYSVTTAVVNGTTYLFVSGTVDGGVSVFSVSSAGSLTNVHDEPGISGARGLDTAVISGITYLYVTAGNTGGVYVYRVNSGGTLISIGNSIISHLDGSANRVITVTVGSNTYGYVTSYDNDRLAGILLSSGFPFQVLTQQLYSDSDLYELNGALGLATAIVDGNTYLYVTGYFDDGITVFQIPSVSTQGLTYIEKYSDSDSSAWELNGASGVTSAYIGGIPYLFVAGEIDDEVSIFRINNGGTLSHVSRITDTSSLALDGAFAVTTAVLSGNTYLFVGGFNDDGISVFRISSGGIATHIDTVSDTSLNELNSVRYLTTAVVGGNLYLFAAGFGDDGVSVFRVNP